MNDNQQLDNILDDALSEYRDAEPLAGLEDRVLQRLHVQPVDRRTTEWKWAAVALCAAMLAFAVWLGSRRYALHGPVDRQQTEATNVDVPPEAKPAAETPRALPNQHAPQPQSRIQAKSAWKAGERLSASAKTQIQVARLDDNPRESHLSAPLTGEERQLLALAQARPDVVRAIAQEDQPIAITPLAIQPLPSEANENGDN
jgi:hypothetical protein